MLKPGSIALLFDHFGPYHVARLRALGLYAVGLEFHGRSHDYDWESVNPEGVKLHTLFTNPLPKPKPGLLRTAVWDSLSQLSPTVVAVPGWSCPGAMAALRWCIHYRIPAILMSESGTNDAPRSHWKEFVKKRLIRLFSSALVGGSSHATYLTQLGLPQDQISWGYDVVDNAHFARPLPNGTPATTTFLASARFIPKKNLPTLIRAYAIYRQQHRGPSAPWNLVILGDGEMRHQLADLVDEKHAPVSLPGFKQYDELPAFYHHASAFIHASTTEQWGLVVNEAMAAGLPVLVSRRCGCAPDLVEEGVNGFTFDPSDEKAIAQLMLQFTSLPETTLQAMGQASARRIADWGTDKFARGLLAAVEVAIDAPPRRATTLDLLILNLLSRCP